MLSNIAGLTDAELGPALEAMLTALPTTGTSDSLIPVDFGSLSVREFGTIYEGLLESKLSIAHDDLTIRTRKGKEHYVPARGNQEIAVRKGTVYFHNKSGTRKSTGSYFTKPFAVKHLLDHALDPALDDHLARLDKMWAAGNHQGAADAFLDFRVADIAMGSGHFLVAAVDRIEDRLSSWLATPSRPGSIRST